MDMKKKNPLSLQLKAEDFMPTSQEEKESLNIMRESVNFWKDGLRRLKKNKIAMVSLGFIILIMIFAYVLPSFWSYTYSQQIKYSENLAPFEYSQKELKRIDKVEWASFTPLRRAGDYEMARNGWVMDYNDASNLIELLYSTNGNNDGKYSNPEFDAAIDASRVADQGEHFKALHDAEAIMMADYSCIPVAYYTDFYLQSPALQGTWHSPYGYWFFQYGYLAE